MAGETLAAVDGVRVGRAAIFYHHPCCKTRQGLGLRGCRKPWQGIVRPHFQLKEADLIVQVSP